MKQSSQAVLSTLAVVACSLVTSVARACPMCFSGNGTNQTAFLYGSLFLMIVPTTAIGTLLYIAWKRTKALENPPPPPAPLAPMEVRPGEPQPRPALRLLER